MVIADDHELVRMGVKAMLKGTEVTIVAEVSTPEDAVKAVKEHGPDIVLFDVMMTTNDDSFIAIEQIQLTRPETAILMFSNYDNPSYVARASIYGATNYLLKDCTRAELVETIRDAAKGETPGQSSLFSRIQRAMSRPGQTVDGIPVTRRELQVLRHVALGLSNKEIANSCSISIETVKEHVQNILRKLNVTDRTAAAVWAVKQQVV